MPLIDSSICLARADYYEAAGRYQGAQQLHSLLLGAAALNDAAGRLAAAHVEAAYQQKRAAWKTYIGLVQKKTTDGKQAQQQAQAATYGVSYTVEPAPAYATA